MVNWITDMLGTAPYGTVTESKNIKVVDVRSMVDRGGNSKESILEIIQEVREYLLYKISVVVCCDHGISRSNSIVAGVICTEEKCSFSVAVQKVLNTTKIVGIRPDVLNDVRAAIGECGIDGTNSNLLITGGSGMLGSLFTSSITNKASIVTPTKSCSDLLEGAVPFQQLMESECVGKVIHFADQHITNTSDYLGNSLIMLKNVLDACEINQTPLTIMSRWEVFAGLTEGPIEVFEDTMRHPNGVLGETKCLFEDLALRYLHDDRVPIQIIRSALVYNADAMPNFMRYIINAGKLGNPINIHEFDNGFSSVDVIHASDWLFAFNQLIKSDEVGTFHLGGEMMCLHNLAEIASTLGAAHCTIEPIRIHRKTAKIALKSNRQILGDNRSLIRSWGKFVNYLK
jgi:nucleoside-diphosphate-sugar epimerase